MHINTAVFETLRESLAPDRLAQVLERTLRVPEAWELLQEPGYLERISEKDLEWSLTPANLAEFVLGHPDRSPFSDQLSSDDEARLDELWQTLLEDSSENFDFRDIALLALGITQACETEMGVVDFIESARRLPWRWRSPLATAWPHIGSRKELLTILLSDERADSIALAVHTLLACMRIEEAAALLFDVAPLTANRTLRVIRIMGEYKLAEALARIMIESPGAKNAAASPAFDEDLSEALLDLSTGDLENARQHVNDAWERASQVSAEIADQVAEIARFDQDAVLEVEARQQALRSQPTPKRRAWLARALMDLDREEEALACLQMSSDHLEERIAKGLAFTSLGERRKAEEHLLYAAKVYPKVSAIDPRWAGWLVDGLKSIGNMSGAVTITKSQVDRTPTSIALRETLAELYEESGDHSGSAAQSNIVLLIDPKHRPARENLARNLQHSGKAYEALPHWKTLAEENSDHLIDLANCALAAEQFATAEDSARSILKSDPDSVDGHVLLGRAKLAFQEFEEAKEYLEKAVQLGPKSPVAWIALADCQEASGDTEAAGKTLYSAAQSSPDNGQLQIAIAKWLYGQGRLNEAMEAAKKAVALDPTQVDWQLDYGNILLELGHYELASPILREASDRQPENWQIRLALAKLYEGKGEFQTAAQFVQEPPPSASPSEHILTGKVLTLAAKSFDVALAESGLKHLNIAREAGEGDSAIEFWMAQASEILGEKNEAFDRYQNFLQINHHQEHALSLDAVLGAARTAVLTDRTPLALSVLESARQKYPTSSELLLQLSRTYQTSNLPDQALRMAQQAVELEPDSQASLRVLSQIAEESGNWDVALETAERLTEIKPDDAKTWIELSQVAQKADALPIARRSLAKALWLGRRSPDILQDAASFFHQTDRLPSATRVLRQAANLQPDEPELIQRFAKLAEELGDLETAQQAWRRCIELQPDNVYALSRGANVLLDLQRKVAAIGLLQRAANIEPNNGKLQKTLAYAYLSNGEIQQGLNHFTLAYEANPSDAEIVSETGQAFLRHGTPEEAFRILQQSVRLQPRQPERLVDLSECLIKLDRVDDAVQALHRAKALGDFSLRARALTAVTSLELDDLPTAHSALEEGRAIKPETREDAITFSNAALRLGEWQSASEALEAWQEEDDDPIVLAERIRLRLRLINARWLYAEAAGALNHAPPSHYASKETLEEIETLIDRVEEYGLAKPIMETLRTWATYTSIQYIDNHNCNEDVEQSNLPIELAQAYVIACLQANCPDCALNSLSKSLTSSKPESWSALLLGLIHTQQGDYSQAIQAYEAAGRNPAVRPLANFLCAHAYWAEDKTPDAIAKFNDALSAWHDEPVWQFQLASLYLKDNAVDVAIPHLQRAVELSPKEGDYLLALGRALNQTGLLSEAEDVYKRALDVLPTHAEAWKEAGQIALALGHLASAKAWLERAFTLSPSDAQCLVGAAQAAIRLGQDKEAMDHIRTASRLAPDDIQVLIGMGEVLAMQGKYEKALRAYDKALRKTKDQPAVQLARCRLLNKIGRAEQAVGILKTLVEEKPEEDGFWAVLAESFEAEDNVEAAVEAAERAVQLAPRDPAYRLTLGRLCRVMGQLDRGLDELSQAQALAPTNPGVLLELGRIYEERREHGKALNTYQNVLNIEPENVQAHFRAGLMFKQQKEYSRAAQMFERSVSLDPKNSDAFHQLAAVRALELVHGGIEGTVVSA
jgi:tetratricopeptide (TPR) repeat protein